MNSLVSVIVPVYKVEKYLDRCIESIVKQTYTNLEIILVDDGSPDNCPKLCDNWAEKDNRIKVIHKENGGVSSARNAGLDSVNGEYVGFVDSDDYIEADMYEKLLKAAVDNNADIVRCSLRFVYENADKSDFDLNDNCKKEKYTKKEFLNELFCDGTLNNSCVNKLYRADKIDGLRFDCSYKIGEDMYFNYKVINKCENIVSINQPLYNYFYNCESVMNNVTNFSDRLMNVKVHRLVFNSHKEDAYLSESCSNMYAIVLFDSFAYAAKNNFTKSEVFRELNSILKSDYKLLIDCPLTKNNKNKLFFCRYFKSIFTLIIKLKINIMRGKK